MSRHANERLANHEATSPQPKPTRFNSRIYPKTPTTDYFSSMALKRDEGDYYFEDHTEALLSALNAHLDQQQPIAHTDRISAVARDMDLVEASYAARSDEYDKILILLRHGEADHNVFERQYAEKNGASMVEANSESDYPIDPMLTGKVCTTRKEYISIRHVMH